MKILLQISILLGLVSCQNLEKEPTLTLSHESKNGRKYYKMLPLKSTELEIIDSENDLMLNSKYFSFDLSKDKKENITKSTLVLNDERRKHKYIEGRNPIPLTNWTVYEDFNGDSILDTMHQGGPDKNHTYILHKNKWIRIQSSRILWKYRETVKNYDLKDEYRFKNGMWSKL